MRQRFRYLSTLPRQSFLPRVKLTPFPSHPYLPFHLRTNCIILSLTHFQFEHLVKYVMPFGGSGDTATQKTKNISQHHFWYSNGAQTSTDCIYAAFFLCFHSSLCVASINHQPQSTCSHRTSHSHSHNFTILYFIARNHIQILRFRSFRFVSKCKRVLDAAPLILERNCNWQCISCVLSGCGSEQRTHKNSRLPFTCRSLHNVYLLQWRDGQAYLSPQTEQNWIFFFFLSLTTLSSGNYQLEFTHFGGGGWHN